MKQLSPEAFVLLKAADYIDGHGWCQGAIADEEGRVCAVGAITMVTGGLDAPMGTRLDVELLLYKYLGEIPVPDWNDRPERTKEQVTAALRSAALNSASSHSDQRQSGDVTEK